MTHPCFSKLLIPFFDCKLRRDLVAKRALCNVGEDWFVGDVTKSPVEFHRLLSPVGLLLPLCASKLDADDCDCRALILFSCNGVVEWIVVGRGKGDGAGDVLLCESAECSDPFDWWCRLRRFKLVLEFVVASLEGELVVLFVLLPLRLKRQSSSVVVICVERTAMITKYLINLGHLFTMTLFDD